MIAAIIIALWILGFALFVVWLRRIAKHPEKNGRAMKYIRCLLYFAAAFYLLCIIQVIVGITNGSKPKFTLLDIPLLLGFAWVHFWLGRRGRFSSQSDSSPKTIK